MHQELLKAKFDFRFYWNDPRLANWPEDTDPPVNIWRPEMSMLDSVENVYLRDNKATISALQQTTTVEAEEEEEEHEEDDDAAVVEAGTALGANTSNKDHVEDRSETRTVSAAETSTVVTSRTKSTSKNKPNKARRSSSSLIQTNPHANIPTPQFYQGNEGRKTGRLLLEFPLESCNIDMLEDPHRMMSFPFDKLRLDFVIILAGEQRVETSDQVCFYWGPVESKRRDMNVYAIQIWISRTRTKCINTTNSTNLEHITCHAE